MNLCHIIHKFQQKQINEVQIYKTFPGYNFKYVQEKICLKMKLKKTVRTNKQIKMTKRDPIKINSFNI